MTMSVCRRMGNVVQSLIDTGKIDIDVADEDGNTALHIAVKNVSNVWYVYRVSRFVLEYDCGRATTSGSRSGRVDLQQGGVDASGACQGGDRANKGRTHGHPFYFI